MIAQCAQFLHRHRRLSIIVTIAVVILCAVFISKGSFSQSVLDMLPLEDHIIAQHVRVLTVFSTMDRIVFELSVSDTTKKFNRLAETARRVMSLLAQSGQFDFSQEISAADFFLLRNLIIRKWPDLFTREDSLWVSKRLVPDSLSGRLERTLSGLFTFANASSTTFMLKHDPFNFSNLALAKLAAFKPAEGITIEDGLITNEKHDRILFFAQTKKSGMAADYAVSVKEVISSVQDHARNNGFTLTWMGALRATCDNNDTIRRDIHLTLPIAVILIFIICFLVYRRVLFGFLTFIPTVLGICLTLALFSYFTKLSIIIIGFGAALLGITVDYAIHYLYQVDDVPEDIDPVRTLTGPIFASALTTAGAFLVLVVAGIPGLAQLGVVTATGIIIVAFLSLTLLPVFVKKSHSHSSSKPRLLLAGLFERFYTKRFDRILLLPVLCIAGVTGFFIPRLSFDGDPDSLNGMKPATIAAEKALAQHWPGIHSGTYLVVTDTSFEMVCRKAEQQLQPLVDTLLSEELIAPAALFTQLLPSREIQKQNRARWEKTFTPVKSEMMRSAMQSVAARFDIEPEHLYQYSTDILSLDSLSFLTREDFPESFQYAVFRNFVHHDDSLWYANIPVFPIADNAWNTVDSLAGHHAVLAVNDGILGLRLVDIIKTGFMKCVLYIPMVIVCILLVMLRDIRALIITILPIILATGITLGLMALFKIPVNIISLMIFAFLFGLGIDYAVLMVFMGRKGLAERKNYIPHGAASITVAACTTLAGLGILALARHPVLTVLGKTGLIGILSSYFCAIIFIPILIKIFYTEKSLSGIDAGI